MKIKPLVTALVAAASLTLFSGASLAAKECKGMSKSSCGASASCTWVKSYSTKKGNKVAAYCRNKGGKGSAKAASKKAKTAKATSKKAAAKKSSSKSTKKATSKSSKKSTTKAAKSSN